MMKIHQLFRQRKPDTIRFDSHLFLTTIKTSKNIIDFFGWDTYSLILYFDNQDLISFLIHKVYVYFDTFIFGSVFYGIR